METGLKPFDSNVVIRPFELGDADAFRRLNEEWITRYFRLEDKDRQMLADPRQTLEDGGQILMSIANGEAVGCCALVPMPNQTFEVSKMAVTEAAQRRGIGRRLLGEAVLEARRLGARRLYLETNSTLTPAIRLYESLGFTHIPPDRVVPSPYQRADVYMELALD